jgi:hypothetical protein
MLPRGARAAVLALVFAAGGCRAPGDTRVARFEPDSIPDAFLYPTAALMWPGATRAFLIQPSGDLYNGVWTARIVADVDQREAAPPWRIAYEDRWQPVAHWTEHAGTVRWDFEAVALPAPEGWFDPARRSVHHWMTRLEDASSHEQAQVRNASAPDSILDRIVVRSARHIDRTPEDQSGIVVSLLVRAVNEGQHPRNATLTVDLVPAESSDPFFDGGEAPHDSLRFGWTAPGRGGLVIAWGEHATPGRRWQRVWKLDAGKARTARFVLPSYPIARDRLDEWAQASHGERVEQARAFWTQEVNRGMSLSLGDPEVENAVRAARVVLLSCRERRDGDWVPIGGPFHYRDVWLRDGARAIQALALHGYVAEARELAASFLEWQWPHGPFVSQQAQLDGTGQAMWALEQAMLRPKPALDVGRYADAAERAWAWCERRRTLPATVPGPFRHMLPLSDPHDNELVRGQLVGTDAWALAGYRAAARLLRAAGRLREASEVERTRQIYDIDFARALGATSSRDVPPAWQGKGYDWGNLSVAYPCDALPADNPRVARLARRYWARAGGAGLGFYGTPDSRHGYVAADLGTWALLAGRPAQADSVLAALLTWRNATGGGAELFTRDAGDYGVNLPPHPSSSAALLTLVRNALLFDDGERLELTLGARARWWANGGEVRGAPTRWGTVSVSFRRRGDEAEWRWTPVPVTAALTLPPGTVLASAPPAPLQASEDGRIVFAPPGSGEARVRVTTAAASAGTASSPARKTSRVGS